MKRHYYLRGGVAGIDLDLMAVEVLAVELLPSISLDSMAVGVAGNETRTESLSLNSFAFVVIGLETY